MAQKADDGNLTLAHGLADSGGKTRASAGRLTNECGARSVRNAVLNQGARPAVPAARLENA